MSGPPVAGVDPGLSATGVVVIADGMVTRAATLRTRGTGGAPDFADVMRRSSEVAEGVAALLADTGVSAVAIEGYEDFGGGHLRGARLRWTTPVTAALIGDRLARAGLTVVWQRPGEVMARYAGHRAAWAAGLRLLPGDQALTSGHTRSAAAHALALIDGRRTGRWPEETS